MSRPKGSKNKQLAVPTVYALQPNERLDLLAGLLIEIISEELWTTD